MKTRPRSSAVRSGGCLARIAYRLCGLAVLMVALVAARPLPVSAQAADSKPTPSAILVFDGSGSMWGKMDGEKQIKLALARDAVRAALGRFSPVSTQLGLMSFGHRRQGDCSDVQMIAPVEATQGPTFTDRIMNPLEKLNPKGKGPLTTALREAATQLAKASGSRSIVLIHDDPDNCREDPCEAIGDLQQKVPGLIIHVVGLGLKPEDATRYQCLTKPTGGKHVNAQDAAQIAAGIADTLQLAALGVTEAAGITAAKPPPTTLAAAAAAAPPPVALAPPVPAIDLAKDGPPAIRLRALLSKERLATSQRIRWTVVSDAIAATPLEVDGADTVLPVEPGAYKVRVKAGLVEADAAVTVAAKGQALAEVVLAAAEIRIKAPLAADATVIVSERAEGAAGAPLPKRPVVGRRLGVWPHGQTSLIVPAGSLLLDLEQGELRSTWPIDLAAGMIRDIDVGQAGGRVTLDLVRAAGPPVAPQSAFGAQPVVFVIEEDDPDAPRGRREIARSAAPAAEFVVAPGTYVVSAGRGSLETRERITVAAGKVVHRALPLVAARLVIGARLGKSPPPPTDRPLDSFRLTRLDADRDMSLVLSGPAAIADVPPGRYRIEARRNNAAIRAEQTVEIRAGEYKAVTLEYQAGELRMDMVTGIEAGESVAWRILDGTGRLVGSGDETDPSLLLTAGRYTVRTDIRGARREQAVEIRAGEVTGVRLQ